MLNKIDVTNHNKIDLYEGEIPFYISEADQRPSIRCFLVPNSSLSCLILPGGGYFTLSEINEGERIAQKYNEYGISAFVCAYRYRPYDGKSILLDAQRAIAFIRHYSSELGVDKDKIFVTGFSAGAHLSMLLCEQEPLYEYNDLFSESTHPNGCIMCYPVCTFENGVYPLMPKIFLRDKKEDEELLHKYSFTYDIDKMPYTYLFCTTNDEHVSPEDNTLAMAKLMQEHNKDYMCQVVCDGAHGIGLGLDYKDFSTWFEKSLEYIKSRLS